MTAEIILGTVAIAQTVILGLTLRSQSVERRRMLAAVIAHTPAEYAMLEKASQPRKVKAHKSPAPAPYGL